MSASKQEGCNIASIENPGSTVRAIMVEDPKTIRGMIAERSEKFCDRCLNPAHSIAGIVFFMEVPSKVLAHLGRNDWALCAGCLDSLKRRGAEALSSVRDLGN